MLAVHCEFPQQWIYRAAIPSPAQDLNVAYQVDLPLDVGSCGATLSFGSAESVGRRPGIRATIFPFNVCRGWLHPPHEGPSIAAQRRQSLLHWSSLNPWPLLFAQHFSNSQVQMLLMQATCRCQWRLHCTAAEPLETQQQGLLPRQDVLRQHRTLSSGFHLFHLQRQNFHTHAGGL